MKPNPPDNAPAPLRRVIGVGLAVLDQLLLWRDMRQPVFGNRIVEYDAQGGGMVGTALVAVTRLGGEAELWASVGDDATAEMILEGLRQERVDVSQVVRVAGCGPMVFVCVDQPTGERAFLYFTDVAEPAEPIGSPERLAEAGCLLVDTMRPRSALRAAQEAQRRGVPVVADLGRVDEDMRGLLACVDHAITSEAAARTLADGDDYRAACEAIRRMGPSHVVVTRGERGLVSLSDAGFTTMPAFAVDVVDTTGAGDTFHGAFCYGLVTGFGLEANLAFASATAALKCRKLGGRAGIPSRTEVEQFLAERGVGLP